MMRPASSASFVLALALLYAQFPEASSYDDKCCLCPNCGRPANALVTTDRFGQTCGDLDDLLISSMMLTPAYCQIDLVDHHRNNCCLSDDPFSHPQHVPRPSPAVRVTAVKRRYLQNAPCDLCEGGRFPNRPNQSTVILDYGTQTCGELFYKARDGDFLENWCIAMRDYFHEPCGCDPDSPVPAPSPWTATTPDGNTETIVPVTWDPPSGPSSPVEPSSPAGPPSGGSSSPACFSGSNTVSVLHKGLIAIDQLIIGDHVRTAANGTYSRVISFSHLDRTMIATYLQIHTTSTNDDQHTDDSILEVSATHMLFVAGSISNVPVRAAQIKPGDVVLGSDDPRVVTSIRSIKRRGVYAPVTTSGELVVSGVRASAYVAVLDVVSTRLQHVSYHALHVPLRVVCSCVSFDVCAKETYSAGMSDYIFQIAHFGFWLAQRSGAVQWGAILIVAPLLGAIYSLEQFLLLLSSTWLLVFLLIGFFLTSKKTQAETRKPRQLSSL